MILRLKPTVSLFARSSPGPVGPLVYAKDNVITLEDSLMLFIISESLFRYFLFSFSVCAWRTAFAVSIVCGSLRLAGCRVSARWLAEKMKIRLAAADGVAMAYII